MCILLPSQTLERTRHSARYCGFSCIQQVCSQNLASSPVLRLPFVSSFSVSQSDCFICCLNCQRVRACLGLLHRMQQHPVQWVVWATAQGDVDDAINCTVLCHQQPSTTEENRAPTKLACISTCISGANVSGNSCKSFWCM